MENVPQVKLSRILENGANNIPEGTKVYDLETKSYYEKHGNLLIPFNFKIYYRIVREN